MRRLALLAVLLCGCAMPVPVAPPVTPGLVALRATAEAVGQVVAQATQAAMMVEQATEDSRATAGAYALQVTQTAEAWRWQTTQAAATVTRQAAEAQQTSSAALARGAATAQAGRLALMGTQTAGDVARGELSKTATIWGVVVSLLAVMLAGVISVASWAQMRITTEHDRRDAETALIEARADRERIMQTALGLAICRAGEWQVMHSERALPAPEVGMVRTVPYTVAGQMGELVVEDPARARVVRLLQACAMDSVVIPPARVLSWSAGEWVAAVRWLSDAGYVLSKRGNGGGTFLKGEYPDVGAVLAEVTTEKVRHGE